MRLFLFISSSSVFNFLKGRDKNQLFAIQQEATNPRLSSNFLFSTENFKYSFSFTLLMPELPERYSLINLNRKTIERANMEVTRFCRATYPSPHGDVADICIAEITKLNNELLELIPK